MIRVALALRLAAVLLWLPAGVLHAQAELTGTPADLPPEAQVRSALAGSPRLQAAVESIATGEARQRQLRAGPHEWQAVVSAQRRKDALGMTHSEQEYGLQTGVRWPWKSSLDRKLGATVQEAGVLQYLDAWHETGRDLLDLWYGWVHAESLAQLAARQQDSARVQRDAVERRVEAGDAARLDLQLAEAELQRASAARIQAQRDAQLARAALTQEFPGLTPSLPDLSSPPPELTGDDSRWRERILQDNHEVELAQAQGEQARLLAERATRERLADPTIGLRYSDNLDGDRRVIGMSFSLPLGGPGRSAAAALARSEARRAEAQARRTLDHVHAAAQSIITDARQSLAGWRDQQEAWRQLQGAADAVARGYEQGEFDIGTRVTASRAAQEAEQEALEARVRAGWAHARVLLDAHLIWRPDREELH